MTELSDDENVQALRAWWERYGLGLLVIIVLSGGSYGGWQFWRYQQVDENMQVSEIYQELHDFLRAEEQRAFDGEPTGEVPESTVLVAQRLKEEHPDSIYATFASLYLARTQVLDDDLPTAVTELEWALLQASLPALRDLIRLRLARIHLVVGDIQRARTAMDGLESTDLGGGALEIKGDILHAEGEFAAAKTAYQDAEDAPEETGQTRYLNFKIIGLPDTDPQTPTLKAEVKDEADTADTSDTVEPSDPADTAEPSDSSDTPDTADTSDMADTPDTTDTSESPSMPENTPAKSSTP